METTKNVYTNGKLTVTYKPTVCINSEKCARELSQVFRTSVIPWINLEAANSKKIINQIKKCPSGALCYNFNRN